jgi:hypothetical protein
MWRVVYYAQSSCPAGRDEEYDYATRPGRTLATMPTIQRGDATIYYEERGSGFPLLLLARVA